MPARPRHPHRRPHAPRRGPLLAGAATLCVAAGLAVVLTRPPEHPPEPVADPAPATAPPAAAAPAPAAAATTSTTAATTTPAGPDPAPTASPAAGGAADLGGCPVAPADSIWRTPVDRLPAAPRSAAYVAAIGVDKHLKADFGAGTWEGAPFGIPITVVPAGTPGAKITFDYADESDRGPYPIPAGALVEGGPNADGDRHVIALDKTGCRVYELYDAHPQGGGSWRAGSGAVFDLRSNALRPAGWTSADAAGLPVLPGLARYEEAAGGRIDHALRITVPRSQQAALWPARHQAGSSTDSALPPMGLRLRLKAGADISGLPPQARAVAQALKTYGAIVADNGSAWYISGTQDDRWDNRALAGLGAFTGADFEAVDVSALRQSPDSGAARRP
ncbi:hypothetical protein AB0K43_23530 [Kitasatospora sp. NPDC049258]|uniref:hypothetical protein n=1 Tax=Kitasatospora sp. NPDC049258 TaxID=3155394 RepID=UPI00344088B7